MSEPGVLGSSPEAEPDAGSDMPQVEDPPEEHAQVEDPPAGHAQGDFRMVVVAGVSVDLPNQFATVVLRETEPPGRQVSFAIGLQDAVALSHAVRRIATPRPLTAELLAEVIGSFDIDIVAVRVVGRQGSTYFAELDLQGRSGRAVLSCRPSDGLTVAQLQRVPVPVLVDRRLLEGHGDISPVSPVETSS
ncbi:MAG: bifunctional nuclease family protein [Acidimicrobiales bacterium]